MNIPLSTDTYKFGHHSQYPPGTTGVYSYFEARTGAKFPETVFFGLQPLLLRLTQPVTREDVDQANAVSFAIHGRDVFNRARWDYIVDELGGKLPVEIKAVAEGTVVPVSNVLFTVENTDPECFWLTSALESYLTHVWHPTTVASISYAAKGMIRKYLSLTSGSLDSLPFGLHDFGYRGATTDQAAEQAGAAHLVNSLGSDTAVSVPWILSNYGWKGRGFQPPFTPDTYEGIAYSVVATEHAIMTALGRAGEQKVVQHLLDTNPTGILSCVIDSYDMYKFVEMIGTHFKHQILARDGKFVFRPDSLSAWHRTKGELNVYLLEEIGRYFGYTVNSKGFKVLNEKVGLIDGDGNDLFDLESNFEALVRAGWSTENLIHGMGGSLHQKDIDRDTQRFAFKSSAQQRNNGPWVDIQKKPLDASKISKAGRLALVKSDSGLIHTIAEGALGDTENLLRVVYRNGELINTTTFEEVRERAA